MLFRERREARQRIERLRTERTEIRLEGALPVSVRTAVLGELASALIPLTQHGAVSLTFGEGTVRAAPGRPSGAAPGSAWPGVSKRLGRVLSLRLDPEAYGDVLRLAAADGVTVSEWIRAAIGSLVHGRQQPPAVPDLRPVGWSCEHMTLTGPPGVLGKVRAGCGCEMQPCYAAA